MGRKLAHRVKVRVSALKEYPNLDSLNWLTASSESGIGPC